MSPRPYVSTRAETVEQAAEWERRKKRYLLAGLCHRCAAQAAWAHQAGTGGWRAVHPPCGGCAGIVEMFACPTANPMWRSAVRKRR